MNIINGLNKLILLAGGEEEFIEHMICNSLFIKPDDVKRDIEAMHIHDILSNRNIDYSLPVRYSAAIVYQCKNGEIQESRGQGRQKTKLFGENNGGIVDSKRGCLVHIDPDGNRAVREKVKEYSGHIVSGGTGSTIRYYMISHIWGNTDDPLFFSSLWNIVLTPLYCSPILDKTSSISEQKEAINGIGMIDKVSQLFKSINYKLYLQDEFNDDEFFRLFGDKDNPKLIEKDSSIDELSNKCFLKIKENIGEWYIK